MSQESILKMFVKNPSATYTTKELNNLLKLNNTTVGCSLLKLHTQGYLSREDVNLDGKGRLYYRYRLNVDFYNGAL